MVARTACPIASAPDCTRCLVDSDMGPQTMRPRLHHPSIHGLGLGFKPGDVLEKPQKRLATIVRIRARPGLSDDLIVPDQNTHGLEVGSPSISIDLNGFEIAGSFCISMRKFTSPLFRNR